MRMKQWTHEEFCKLCERNGYYYSRNNGSHAIYVNDKGNHISVPLRIASVIAQRLIKENDLSLKKKKHAR